MRRSSQSYMADSRFPTMDGSTSTTSIDYNGQGLTGTIPTEVSAHSCLHACMATHRTTDFSSSRTLNLPSAGAFVSLTYHLVYPLQFGLLTDVTYMDLGENKLSGSIPTEVPLFV